MKINLPFQGFYESIHNNHIDYNVTSLFDSEGTGELDEFINADNFYSDYSLNEWGIYKEYCKQYTQFLSNQLEIKFKYEKTESPREYNFETDRIFADITLKEVKRLFDETPPLTLADTIKERFTSCSGFISYYSEHIQDWLDKPIKDWDHNEIGTLLIAWATAQGYDLDKIEGDFLTDCHSYEFIQSLIPSEFYDKYSKQESEVV